MPDPFFSIVVPAYNYAHYLPEAIDSVLSQTFQDFEILISDDCSTDNTEELVKTRYGNDKRIVYWKNVHNLGSQRNVNLCYQKTKGKFVNYLQADDYYTDDTFLETAATTLQDDPEISFYYTAGKFITNEGHIARDYQPYFRSWSGPGVEHFGIITRLPPWPTFIFVRANLLQSLGGEVPKLKVADFELTMRLCLASKCHFEASSKVASRVHSEAQGIREGYDQEIKVCINNLQCIDHFLENHADDPKIREIVESTRTLYESGLRKHYFRNFNPEHLNAIFSEVCKTWIQQNKRVVIYCGGEHTRRLLEWTDLSLANIVAIVDGNPALHATKFFGRTIHSPHDISSLQPDVVVISSVSMPDEIAASLRHLSDSGVQIFNPYPYASL